jgi:RNA polymerase sigma-70 factor, ECF subfamily
MDPLATAIATARAAHPDLALDDEALATALVARLPEGSEPATALAGLRVADVLLASAAVAGDPAAVAAFDPLLVAEVRAAAASVRAPGDTGDEVLQRLRAALLVGDGERGPTLADYAGRGDLRGFLRVSAVRECLRLMRRQAREVGADEDALAYLAEAIDPQIDQLKAAYRDQLAAAVTDALTRLDARERRLLRYQLGEKLSIDQIGALYGVHRATAARWLERARQRVAELTEQLLADRLALPIDEVASVIRLVRSQVHVSMERLLGRTDHR